MRYAETGFNLEIDLTRGNIERVATDPELTRLHLGGLGTNAKILWDRVPPETQPFDPGNLLIFSTGLLCGTPAFSCNRTVVSAISPQTRLFGFSMMGGFWGPELKHAGYDKIVIRGKSPEWVYLWINDDEVEILRRRLDRKEDELQLPALSSGDELLAMRAATENVHVEPAIEDYIVSIVSNDYIVAMCYDVFCAAEPVTSRWVGVWIRIGECSF
mgnify:CR=1 FL=1